MLPQVENVVSSIRTLAEMFSQAKIENLTRAENLGKALSFEGLKSDFEGIIGLSKQILLVNLPNLPLGILNNIHVALQKVDKAFASVLSFNIRSGMHIDQERSAIIKDVQESYQHLFASTVPPLVFLKDNDKDIEKIRIESQLELDKIAKVVREVTDLESVVRRESEKLMLSIQDAAGKVVVGKYSNIFKEEAEYHSGQSLRWLGGSGVFALLTLLWALFSGNIYQSLNPNFNASDNSMLIGFILSKLVILSSLYYGVVICVRNFSASRHNYIVNRHRQNALNTFDAFVQMASNDPATMNIVLTQAAQSIFSAQHSGYGGRDQDTDSPNKVVEILRSITSEKH